MNHASTVLWDRLISELRQLVDFLRIQNERRWEEWFLVALGRMEKGDSSGLCHIKSAYGGAGSFSDLAFLDGSINRTLELLRANVWLTSDEMQRRLD